MHRNSQRGAALLTVLILVALISVMAATSLEKLRLSTRLATNTVALSQARADAMMAEAMAVTRITAILRANADRITLAGGWSGRPIPLPVPGGVATATVRDGGNCFNLNSLAIKAGDAGYASFTPARLQFARLIRLVGGRVASPEAIAAAASDWIDSDNTPIEGGAEDDAYAGLSPGYRTPNTLIADVSELRAVQGVTPDLYRQLRPWLCALPQASPAKINVNTLAPEQAPLLVMLAGDNLSVEAARQALLTRPEQGFATVSDFWGQRGLAAAAGDAQSGSAVTSAWFALDIAVTVNGARMEEHALIDASRLPARLVSRQWGEDT